MTTEMQQQQDAIMEEGDDQMLQIDERFKYCLKFLQIKF
jgi:hypothetical protein